MSNNQITPQFQRSSEETKVDFSNKEWNGFVMFHDVFSTCFLDPQNVDYISSGFWNNNAIYLVQAFYGKSMIVSISCSTLPEGREPEEDIQLIYKDMLRTAKKKGKTSTGHDLMTVDLMDTKIGTTIWYNIINVAAKGQNGPLPLNIGASYPIEDGLKSMCFNVVFQRPQAKSRVELSVFYKIPSDFVKKAGQDVAGDLKQMLKTELEQFFGLTYIKTFGEID